MKEITAKSRQRRDEAGWYPRQELNLHPELRRLVLCPLSYGGSFGLYRQPHHSQLPAERFRDLLRAPRRIEGEVQAGVRDAGNGPQGVAHVFFQDVPQRARGRGEGVADSAGAIRAHRRVVD